MKNIRESNNALVLKWTR